MFLKKLFLLKNEKMSLFIYFKSDFVKHVMFFSILNRFGQDFVKQVTATFRNKDLIQAGLRFFLLIFWNGLQQPISIFLLGSCSTPPCSRIFYLLPFSQHKSHNIPLSNIYLNISHCFRKISKNNESMLLAHYL